MKIRILEYSEVVSNAYHIEEMVNNFIRNSCEDKIIDIKYAIASDGDLWHHSVMIIIED